MTRDRWRQVEAVFDELCDLSPAEQSRRLGGLPDADLRAAVEKLLRVDQKTYAGLTDALSDAAANATQPSPTPTRFGPWRALGVVGRGGMGSVYRAQRDDRAFDKQAAVKVLDLGLDNPASRERFRQERSILATLDHPNIARLLDGGETESGLSYIVMEYVDGEPIVDYCVRHNLSRQGRLALFLQVCSAVQYAHQNLIVHHDLKPANILVTRDGVPKLLDFGIAKLLEPGGMKTMTGFLAMTPQYASPEQIRGQPVTTASDVYSLGMVLYEMLSLRRPYQVDTASVTEIARVVCEVEPAPPRLDEDLDNILLKALRKEPSRRYASARELADDIERAHAHLPVSARPDTLYYRASRFARRNRMGLAAGLLVLAVLIAGIVVSQYQARRAQRRFDDVRGLAGALLSRIDPKLQDVAGTTPAREELVRTSLAYLESLARDTGGDAALQLEIAAAYVKVGGMQNSLNRSGNALSSLYRARDIGEGLLARGHSGEDVSKLLCDTYLNIGSIEAAHGGGEAAANLDKSLAIARRLRTVDGSVYESIAKAYARIGRWQNDSHDVAGAVQSMEAAVRTAEQWVASSSNDAAALAELATAHQHLSNALRLRGDLAGALGHARRMEEIALRQYRADPGSVSRRSLLVRAYQAGMSGSVSPIDMVMALLDPGKVGPMIALAEELAAKEPGNTGLTDMLGRAYVARCLVEAPAVGVPACRKAVHLYDRLHEADQGNYYFLATRSIARMALAAVLRRQGDRAEGLQLAVSTVAELRRRRREDSTMLLCLLVAGEVELDSGEPGLARRDFEEAHRLARLGYDADAKDARYSAFLAQSLEGLGAFARQARDWNAAAAWYRKAVDVWKEWPARGVTGKYDQEHLRLASKRLEECRERAGESR